MKMKKNILFFMVAIGLILNAPMGFSATVNTPMTEDLNGDGYGIYNVSDLIVEGPWADVRAFGADPSGVNDSAPAFQSAATSGAGTVFVPKGTYRLNSSLTFGVNVVMDGSDLVKLNYYGTGTAIIFQRSGGKLEGFTLASKAPGQNGVQVFGNFVKVRNIYIRDFDGIGFQLGQAGVCGAYYSACDEIYCLNTTTQGTAGILVDGGIIPNTNANTFRNAVVRGKWTTLYHIKGHRNLFTGGDCVPYTNGTGVNDCWKIEGVGNEINGSYFENGEGTALPQRCFTFTSGSFDNRIKNIYVCAGMANVGVATQDEGWGNEVNFGPLGWNYPFAGESRSGENLIPNSHFKNWNGNAPVGWANCNSNVSQDGLNVRGANYSLKLGGSSANSASCYIAGHASSITGLPIERFQGKTVVAGVWVKSSAPVNPLKINVGAGYGNNYHTGDGTWQFVTAMCKVPSNATYLFLQLRSGGTDVYFSEPVLVEGNHLPYPSPRPLNDGYARMTGPFIGGAFITFPVGDTTPSVVDGNNFKTANTSVTTITGFDNGTAGQEITIIFTDANTSVSDSGSIKLSGSFSSTANATLKLIFDGTNWFELSRSFN